MMEGRTQLNGKWQGGLAGAATFALLLFVRSPLFPVVKQRYGSVWKRLISWTLS